MEQKNNLVVPISIIIAGLLIAGAVYMSNKNRPVNTTGQVPTEVPTSELKFSPITASDHIRGNPSAAVMIVEYSDTSCPFCKRFHETMKQVVDVHGKNGTVAWVYRHFPLKSIHPNAEKEAQALECAAKLGGNDGFWAYTDKVYATTPSDQGKPLDPAELPKLAKEVGLNEQAFNTCLTSGEYASRVEKDLADALAAGGSGTPFNILIPSKKFDQEKVKEFFMENVVKYQIPPDLFSISADGSRIAVSGSMPFEFMDELIKILTN